MILQNLITMKNLLELRHSSDLILVKEATWGLPKEGEPIDNKKLAHSDDTMTCFSCHSAWVTSCGGCHLPIEANWKKTSNHYDGKESRNWATYNPQVARDEMFQLGLHGPAKGGKIAPIRIF